MILIQLFQKLLLSKELQQDLGMIVEQQQEPLETTLILSDKVTKLSDNTFKLLQEVTFYNLF